MPSAAGRGQLPQQSALDRHHITCTIWWKRGDPDPVDVVILVWWSDSQLTFGCVMPGLWAPWLHGTIVCAGQQERGQNYKWASAKFLWTSTKRGFPLHFLNDIKPIWMILYDLVKKALNSRLFLGNGFFHLWFHKWFFFHLWRLEVYCADLKSAVGKAPCFSNRWLIFAQFFLKKKKKKNSWWRAHA